MLVQILTVVWIVGVLIVCAWLALDGAEDLRGAGPLAILVVLLLVLLWPATLLALAWERQIARRDGLPMPSWRITP